VKAYVRLSIEAFEDAKPVILQPFLSLYLSLTPSAKHLPAFLASMHTLQKMEIKFWHKINFRAEVNNLIKYICKYCFVISLRN
jgi:hypothetical protein